MIGWLIDRLLDASAWLHGRAPGGDMTTIENVTLHVDDPRSPIDLDDDAVDRRIEDGLSLHDNDTYGYVLMTLKRPAASPESRIIVSGFVRPEWQPAFVETARRMIEAVEHEPVR